MKKLFVIVLALIIFCSSVSHSSAEAGQIQAQKISQVESKSLEIMETSSATLVDSVEGGGDDGLAIIGGVFLVLCLLAAAAG